MHVIGGDVIKEKDRSACGNIKGVGDLSGRIVRTDIEARQREATFIRRPVRGASNDRHLAAGGGEVWGPWVVGLAWAAFVRSASRVGVVKVDGRSMPVAADNEVVIDRLAVSVRPATGNGNPGPTQGAAQAAPAPALDDFNRDGGGESRGPRRSAVIMALINGGFLNPANKGGG